MADGRASEEGDVVVNSEDCPQKSYKNYQKKNKEHLILDCFAKPDKERKRPVHSFRISFNGLNKLLKAGLAVFVRGAWSGVQHEGKRVQFTLARTVPQCNLEETMSPRFAALLACCLAGLLVLLPGRVAAAPSTRAADRPVAQEPITVEMLRLAVPAALRDAWLNAEAEVWKPWLEQQPAYLGRDLYWDPQQEEAQVLIRWRSQQEWKAIADEDVAAVQARFVAAINQATAKDAADPIPLMAASRWLLLARDAPEDA